MTPVGHRRRRRSGVGLTHATRHAGIVVFAVLWPLAPLVTPGAAVPDPLASATAVVPTEAPPATPVDTAPPAEPDSAGTPDVTPEPAAVPEPAVVSPPAVPVSGTQSQIAVLARYSPVEIVLLVVAALVTGLALVGVRERIRVPLATRASDPAERGFPSPALTLVLAPGTDSARGTFLRAADLRFAMRAEVLVLPVLARTPDTADAWAQWHDVADTWLWHESWLRASPAMPSAVHSDGLLLGRNTQAPSAGLWRIPESVTVGVVPVSEGIILSRAAGSVSEVHRRWVDRVRIWRWESRTRPAAAILILHALVTFPLGLVVAAAALVLDVPGEVLAAALAPTAVGVLSAALRWAALDDLDRLTSLRVPPARGLVLLLTGPLHAAVVWAAAWRAMLAPTVSELRGASADSRVAA